MVAIPLVLADTTFFEGDLDNQFTIKGQNNENATSIYCGNAICDKNETCQSCKVDYGECVISIGEIINQSEFKSENVKKENEIPIKITEYIIPKK